MLAEAGAALPQSAKKKMGEAKWWMAEFAVSAADFPQNNASSPTKVRACDRGCDVMVSRTSARRACCRKRAGIGVSRA
jgi:hypothetical protein